MAGNAKSIITVRTAPAIARDGLSFIIFTGPTFLVVDVSGASGPSMPTGPRPKPGLRPTRTGLKGILFRKSAVTRRLGHRAPAINRRSLN
jgi:hypothetical protein